MTKIVCEAGQFKTFCQIALAVGNESRLRLTPDGISTRFVDTANVAMIEIVLPGWNLREYNYDPAAPVGTIGINWKTVHKFLKAAGKKTPLSVSFGNKQVSLSYGVTECKIPYIPDANIRKDPNTPTITLGTTFQFDGSILNQLCMIAPSDKCVLTVDKGIAEVKAFGNDEHGETSVGFLLARAVAGEHKEPKRGIYSLDYLKEFRLILNKQFVEVSFATDHPLRLKSTVSGIKIDFLLAPRIEAD